MWILFRLKSQKGGRAAYANAMMKLVGYPNNKEEVHELWDAEVAYLGPGDFVYACFLSVIMILSSNVHAGYSPPDRSTELTHP